HRGRQDRARTCRNGPVRAKPKHTHAKNHPPRGPKAPDQAHVRGGRTPRRFVKASPDRRALRQGNAERRVPPPRQAGTRRPKAPGRPSLKTIAVIGPGSCSPEEAALAEEVGRLLAEAGVALVCGGMSGVTEAACKGAFQAGGMTIGFLPGEDASEANPYVRLGLPTGMGETRN